MAVTYPANGIGPIMSASPKDPDAVVDYAFDWSSWLASGETVSSYTVTVNGVTLDSDSQTTTAVTAWLSGGTAGTLATVACKIVTSDSRTDERTINVKIRER
jgi:hypothetical protein